MPGGTKQGYITRKERYGFILSPESYKKISKTKTYKRITVNKTCPKCNSYFQVIRKINKQEIEIIDKDERKFCSRKCANFRIHTKESKEKISNSLKGNIPWCKGLTKETDERLKIKSENSSGKNSYNWKNGKIKTKKGYIYMYCPDHPFAVGKYVLEHRLIAEKHLGRLLSKEEVVHHINGIKNDNRPENLYLFENDIEHRKIGRKNPIFLISNILNNNIKAHE